MRQRSAGTLVRTAAIGVAAVSTPGGCGMELASRPAPLFMTPLIVDDVSVGEAIIDTGGAYEVILREDFGLALVDTVEVLAFHGPEHVAVTEPFPYTAGGVSAKADFALVGLSACDCNGLGFRFFRKTQTVLSLDFTTFSADHVRVVPPDGVAIAFAAPPAELLDFDSAFMQVNVERDGQSIPLLGLLDTGTNRTALRRGLFDKEGGDADHLTVRVHRGELGTVAVATTLFDTPGLPDIILGTDVMGAWSDRWYFMFAPVGGLITVYPQTEKATTE